MMQLAQMRDNGTKGEACVTLETATLERDGFVVMRSFFYEGVVSVGCRSSDISAHNMPTLNRVYNY